MLFLFITTIPIFTVFGRLEEIVMLEIINQNDIKMTKN